MDLKELKKSDLIILEYLRGSHLYGTNIASSDEDIGGIFKLPNTAWFNLEKPIGEISDEKHDINYFELKKYIMLASTANPTVMEALWLPDDCVRIKTPIADELIKYRKIFLTKKCYWSYLGYAFAQIKKAKGKNKKVNDYDKYINKELIDDLKINQNLV